MSLYCAHWDSFSQLFWFETPNRTIFSKDLLDKLVTCDILKAFCGKPEEWILKHLDRKLIFHYSNVEIFLKNIYVLRKSKFTFTLLHKSISQESAEIRHFRKYLDNSGNAWSFQNCLACAEIEQITFYLLILKFQEK